MEYQDSRTPIQRLKSFMDQNGININLLSKNIGMPYSTLRDNIKGTDPKFSTIIEVAKHIGLSLNWLVLGIGPVYIKDINQPIQYPSQHDPEPQVNDTYNINIGHSTQTVEQLTEQPKQQPAPAISADTALLVKQLIEQNHQLYEQNVLLMDQNRSLSEQLIKLINK